MFADAGQHILQRAALGCVIKHVANRHQRQAMLARQPGEHRHMTLVRAAMGTRQGKIEMIRESFAQPFQCGIQPCPGRSGRRDHRYQQALAMGQQIIERQMAFALGRATLAGGQQLAQMSVGRAVLGPDQNIWCRVHEHQPAARRIGQSGFFGRHVTADHAGQRIAVSDGYTAEAQPRGLHHQFLGVGRAAQKGEIAGGGQFGIGRSGWQHRFHAKRPCMYQAGSLVSRP